jgi:hypothetical protein
VACGELALLLQHLEGERGGRQRKRQPDEQRRPRGKPEHRPDRRQNEGGGEELRRAEAENGRAQCPQPDRAKLEPDYEQEQHHAELAELENLLDIVEGVERSQHIGADDDAGAEIAEHRANPEEAAERRSNSGGCQKNHHLDQLRRCHGCLVPLPSLGTTRIGKQPGEAAALAEIAGRGASV